MFSDFMAAALLEILFKLAKLSRDGTIDQLISDPERDPTDEFLVDMGMDKVSLQTSQLLEMASIEVASIGLAVVTSSILRCSCTS